MDVEGKRALLMQPGQQQLAPSGHLLRRRRAEHLCQVCRASLGNQVYLDAEKVKASNKVL